MKAYAQKQNKPPTEASTSVTGARPVRLQTKLRVNTPGDIYEQEADRVAAQVTRISEPQTKHVAHEHLRAKTVSSNEIAGIEAPFIVHEALRSPGQSLDPFTQASMESRFGHDFSGVRVHTDAQAADAASALAARAFTAGRNIGFNTGEYAPRTESGRRLLSHELAHVVQQQAVSATSPTTNPLIQRKLVDQRGGEIKVNLEGVKPGDTVQPEFPEKSSSRVRKDTSQIVNAMLKTPSGLRALTNWIQMPAPIALKYTEKVLVDDQDKEAHGLSQMTKKGVTDVSISGATVGNKSDRYRRLQGEQLWNAVAAHESVHQTNENLDISKRHTALLNEIDEAGDDIKTKDPRLAKSKELGHEKEVGPVRLELTSLIEYDILYPEKAGNWLTRSFEKFLGKEIYAETVNSAVEGLVSGAYFDPARKSDVLDIYLHHTKRPPKKK
ncbi:MAG: hypothetical protein QOI07_1774 [Verrucomicrobiota bacterium]